MPQHYRDQGTSFFQEARQKGQISREALTSLEGIERRRRDLEGVSLVPPVEQEPPMGDKEAKAKAAEAHFALGEDYSPGPLVLEEKYLSGRESDIREMAKRKALDAQSLARNSILEDFFHNRPDPGAPLSPEETEYVQTVTTTYPYVDERTVLEEQLAEKYVDTLISRAAEDSDEVAEGLSENPQKAQEALDFNIKDITTQSLIDKEMRRLANRNDSTAKTVSDFVEKFIPGKEALEYHLLGEDVEDLPNEAILPGNSIKEKFDYFYTLPTEAQAELLPQITDTLAERNVLTAANFLARLQSYSASDQRFENIIGALDLVDLTTATGVLAGATKLGAVIAAGRAAVTGSVRRPLGVTKALDSMGDIASSSHIRAKNRIRRLANNLPETADIQDVFETVPSLFNPRSIITGGDESLSAVDQARLLTLFRKNAGRLMGGIDDTLIVQRIREGDIDGVLLAVRDQVAREFPRTEDKIVDAKVAKRAQDTLTVNDVIEVIFGDLNGELFTSQKRAKNTAELYGIPQPYEIKQKGGRWGIHYRTTVDEKSPYMTSLKLGEDEITPQTRSYVRELIRRFETPEDSFSQAGREDRRVGVLGASRLLGITRAADQVFQGLGKKSRNQLADFLNAERRSINERGEPGRFADNLGEFQAAWHKRFDRSPTANEVAGYFTYRQLSDMDWTIRNFSALGGKLRNNLKNVTVSLPKKGEFTFEGKPSSFDQITNETAGVLVVRGNGQHKYLRTNTAEAKAEVERMVSKGGYQINQVSPKGEAEIADSDTFRKIVGSGGVDFVLAKSARASRLPTKQIEYTPGGHIVYDDGHFTGQPRIHREVDPNTNNLTALNYRGDNILFWFRTRAEAQKYTPMINEARQILKSGRGSGGKLTSEATRKLKNYLDINLPIFTVNKFKNMFREFKDDAVFSVQDDFEVTDWGRNTNQYNKLSDKYGPMLRDETSSSYNLYTELRQTFLGERSEPLLTIKERAGKSSPVIRLDNAPVIDAFPALERGLNGLIDNKFLDDLKINAANRFVREFGDLLETDKNIMMRNPLPHLYNPKWRTNADPVKKRVAENYLRSTKELLNVDNSTNRVLRTMQQNLMDSVYRVGGQEAVSKIPDWALGAMRDPTAFFRAAAFHMTLGLFNPVQLFVQGTTFVHIAALGGTRNAVASAPAAFYMQVAKHTAEPAILEEAAKKASAFGWKKEHWLEANAALQRSGFGVLGREQALLDEAFNPQFVTTSAKRGFDKAAFFFNGIERAIRHGAYATAYRRWRTTNPKAKFDDAAERLVLSEAQKYTVDMTANANAMWQRGWPSIPTQFWSYATRMMEQFLGKRLSTKEKARLLTFYGAAFGVPATVALPTSYPFSEDVRDHLNRKGIDIDDTVWETFRDGVVATAVEGITGTDFDISGRLSPEGLGVGQTIKDIFTGDKTNMELLVGIGGGRIAETVLSMVPPVYRFMFLHGEENDKAPFISPEEARQIVTNVSSLKQAERLFFALNYDAYYTKRGHRIATSTPMEGVLTAIMGFQPDYVAQVYSMRNVSRDMQQFKNKVGAQIRKEYSAMFRALERNDLSAARAAERTISAWFQGGGFTPEERINVYQGVLEQNKDMIDLIDNEYIDGSIEDRQDRAIVLESLREERDKELNRQREDQE